MSDPPLEGVATADEAVVTAGRTTGSLRERAARGVIVNSTFTLGAQALTVVRGFLVAIFLAPEDYGIWAIVVISYTALGRLKSIGVADKYIQQDEPDQVAAFQKAFTLEAILMTGLAVVIAAATPLLALAYRTPEIVAPTLVSLLAIPAAVL